MRQLQETVRYLTSTLLEKVARSREAELEASGRATGLGIAVETLRQENASLRSMNELLFTRALGATTQPSTAPAWPPMGPAMSMVQEHHAPSGLPNIVGGVPAGSPRPPMHVPPGSAFDPALPPVGVAQPREQAQYAGNAVGDQDFFTDIGDDAARSLRIETDETTGALVGGPSLPVPPQNRTQ